MEYLKNISITSYTDSANWALTRADAKLHLNILDTSFDDLIDDYLAAAHQVLYKECSILVAGTAVGYLDKLKDFVIDVHPIDTVVVKYYDSNNTLQTWDAANYIVTNNRVEIIGSEPNTYDRDTPWQVTVTTSTSTDPGVAQALRFIVADLFENRQAEAVGSYYQFTRGTQHMLSLISKRIEI